MKYNYNTNLSSIGVNTKHLISEYEENYVTKTITMMDVITGRFNDDSYGYNNNRVVVPHYAQREIVANDMACKAELDTFWDQPVRFDPITGEVSIKCAELQGLGLMKVTQRNDSNPNVSSVVYILEGQQRDFRSNDVLLNIKGITHEYKLNHVLIEFVDNLIYRFDPNSGENVIRLNNFVYQAQTDAWNDCIMDIESAINGENDDIMKTANKYKKTNEIYAVHSLYHSEILKHLLADKEIETIVHSSKEIQWDNPETWTNELREKVSMRLMKLIHQILNTPIIVSNIPYSRAVKEFGITNTTPVTLTSAQKEYSTLRGELHNLDLRHKNDGGTTDYTKRFDDAMETAHNSLCHILRQKDELDKNQKQLANLKTHNIKLCMLYLVLQTNGFIDRPMIGDTRRTLTKDNWIYESISTKYNHTDSENLEFLLGKFENIAANLKWLASQEETIINDLFYATVSQEDAIFVCLFLASITDNGCNKEPSLTAKTFNEIAKSLARLRNRCVIANAKGFDVQNSCRIIRWLNGDKSATKGTAVFKGILEITKEAVADQEKILVDDVIQNKILNAFRAELQKESEDDINLFNGKKKVRSFPKKDVVDAKYHNLNDNFYKSTTIRNMHKFVQEKCFHGNAMHSSFVKIDNNSEEHIIAQAKAENENAFASSPNIFNALEDSKNSAGCLFLMDKNLNSALKDDDIKTKQSKLNDPNKYWGDGTKHPRPDLIESAERFKMTPWGSWFLSLKTIDEKFPETAATEMWTAVNRLFDY